MDTEPDRPCTSAFADYAYEVTRLVGFFDALDRLKSAATRAAPVLAVVTRPTIFSEEVVGGLPEAERDELRAHLAALESVFTDEDRKNALDAGMWLYMSRSALDDNTHFLLQTTFCRLADNFLTFLGDLLAKIYTTRPETLLHHDTDVPLSEILRHRDVGSIVAAVAERRVFGLGYKGIVELNATIRSKLKFDLIDAKLVPEVERVLRTRNVLVHARGRVREEDAQYFGVEPGARLLPTEEEVFVASKLLNDCARSADRRAIAKFGLAAAPLSRLEWDFDDQDRER